MALKKEDFLLWIEEAKTSELMDLITSIEEKFGVVASSVTASVPGITEATKEEQTEFDVVLQSFDPSSKIAIIKVVKDVAMLSLADSKKLVESAPKLVKGGISKADSEVIKKKLEEAGAKVEIK